jgi:hypothetical protein
VDNKVLESEGCSSSKEAERIRSRINIHRRYKAKTKSIMEGRVEISVMLTVPCHFSHRGATVKNERKDTLD